MAVNPSDDEHPATRIRPDVIIDFQTQQQIPFHPRERPAQGSRMLLDIKTLGVCQNTPYFTKATFQMGPGQVLDQESLAVRTRANLVNKEYLAKAKKRDTRFMRNIADPARVEGGAPRSSPSSTRRGAEGTTTTNNNANRVGPFTRTIKSYGQVKG